MSWRIQSDATVEILYVVPIIVQPAGMPIYVDVAIDAFAKMRALSSPVLMIRALRVPRRCQEKND
jgi:hypothetical protein